MANTIPPIPYKVKVSDSRGYVSDAWSKFFLFMFDRVGGTTGDSNTELSESVTANTNNITDLLLRVEALEQEPIDG